MSQFDVSLDKQNMLGSVSSLADQIRDAWAQTRLLPRHTPNQPIQSIVVFGMGGSALGAHVIQSVWRDVLKVPLVIINDYTIPAWVNERSLAIISSYSGTTEETVEAMRHIKEVTQHVAVITSGGALADYITAQDVLGYVIQPTYNPCGQPRMALGYSIFGTLGLLERFGLVSLSQAEIDAACAGAAMVVEKNNSEISTESNFAKQVAAQLHNQLIWIFGSEHLLASAHVMANQVNENSKVLATHFSLPEANHHLLEGLVFPPDLLGRLTGVGIVSHHYHPRNQVRYAVTQDVMQRQGGKWIHIEVPEASLLQESAWMLAFGGYVSVYLALMEGIDPSPIPQVDYFKQQLAAQR